MQREMQSTCMRSIMSGVLVLSSMIRELSSFVLCCKVLCAGKSQFDLKWVMLMIVL